MSSLHQKILKIVITSEKLTGPSLHLKSLKVVITSEKPKGRPYIRKA